MKKRILISIPFARMIRFFLDTYIFEELVNQNIEIVVVHNQKTVSNIIGKYDNVSEVGYPGRENISKIKKVIRSLVDIPGITKRCFGTGYVGFKNLFLGKASIKEILNTWAKVMLALIIYYLPFIGKKVYREAFYDKKYENFMKENNIDGIVLTCPCLEVERLLAQAANKLSIPVVMGVDGWDTLTNFGYVQNYKGVMVWGKQMALHAKELGFNDKEIIYTGIPYREKFIEASRKINKSEVKGKYGIHESEKVILVFGNNWYAAGEIEKENVNSILNAIETGELINTKLIFRLSPRNELREEERYYYNKYSSNKNIIFQKPDKGFIETEDCIISSDILNEVIELYAIADININILSMCILESSFFGVPSILCNNKDEFYPTRYVTKGCIYKNLIENGVAEISSSKDLVKTIKSILDYKEQIQLNIVSEWDKKDPDFSVKIMDVMFENC
jgi:hypothetical protein